MYASARRVCHLVVDVAGSAGAGLSASGGRFAAAVAAGEGKAQGATSGDDELSGLRPYVLGDSLSRVAWKRYGRGELLLKQFAGEGAPQLLLDFAAIPGGTEQRLSQLAQWIVEAEAQGLSYALRLQQQYFDFGHGREQREACLCALALFGGGA